MRTTKLQEDVRLVAEGGNEDRPIYLVEEAPRHRLAFFGHQLYRLPLPWTYYVVIHNKLETRLRMFGHNNLVRDNVTVKAVYCSPKWARRDTDGLDWLPVSNSAPNQVCHFGVTVGKDMGRLEVINHGIESFWASNGNGALSKASNLQKALTPSEKSTSQNTYYGVSLTSTYKDWEKFSIDEVLSLPYETVITVGKLISEITENTIKEVTGFNYR